MGCSVEENIRKFPAANPQKAGQPHTDTGSVLACAAVGTALLGFTLSWFRRLGPRPVPGLEHSLCFYPLGVTGVPESPPHSILTASTQSPTAAQPCAHREYKWWVKLPGVPVLSLGDHRKLQTPPKQNCWFLSVPKAFHLKHQGWRATLLRNAK